MINIREAIENDIDAMVNIETASFSVPWSRTAFEESFENRYTKMFVAEDEDKVVGYSVIGLIVPDAEILNVAVEESYRRQGIGEMLIDSLIALGDKEDVSDFFLEVRASNEPAIELYRKKGMEVIGRRKDYYDMPVEDAVLMHYKNESGEILC